MRAGLALGFAYWCFYIHRNELIYQLYLEKRVALFWVMCSLVTILVSRGHVRFPSARARPTRLNIPATGFRRP